MVDQYNIKMHRFLVIILFLGTAVFSKMLLADNGEGRGYGEDRCAVQTAKQLDTVPAFLKANVSQAPVLKFTTTPDQGYNQQVRVDLLKYGIAVTGPNEITIYSGVWCRKGASLEQLILIAHQILVLAQKTAAYDHKLSQSLYEQHVEVFQHWLDNVMPVKKGRHGGAIF